MRLESGRSNPDDLAALDLAHVLCADRTQRARLRCDDVAALAERTEAERPHAPRIAESVELVLRAEDDRVCAARVGQNRGDPVEHRALRFDDQLRHDFGIGCCLQHRRRGERLAKLVGVGQVSVVCEGEVAELRAFEQRLRVDDQRRTGRRVARVADCDVAAEPAENLFVEDGAEQTHLLVRSDRPAVSRRDTGRLLSAMLQRIQRKEREAGCIASGCEDSGYPAHLTPLYQAASLKIACRRKSGARQGRY